MNPLKRIAALTTAAAFTSTSLMAQAANCLKNNEAALNRAFASFSKSAEPLETKFGEVTAAVTTLVNSQTFASDAEIEKHVMEAVDARGVTNQNGTISGSLRQINDKGALELCLTKMFSYPLPDASRTGNLLSAKFYLNVCNNNAQSTVTYTGGIVTHHGGMRELGLRPMTSIEPVSKTVDKMIEFKQFTRDDLPSLQKGVQEIIGRNCKP